MLAWLLELGLGPVDLGVASTAVVLLVEAVTGGRGPRRAIARPRRDPARDEPEAQAADT